VSENIIGSWVKIPGLQPDEPGALHYLDTEQLGKLRERVDKAIRTATEKATVLEFTTPGALVWTTKKYSSVPKGVPGYVADRDMIAGHEYQPDDYVPVCFRGYGLGWVPVSYLRVSR
jgi:hypothetical protein